MNEKIFLGLDIGTESVGWAVTDEKYKLKKFRGNLMWGSHIFDEAEHANERRSFRISRRRLNRRKQRISFLQDFFAEEINKIDSKFFLRLKESSLYPEDSENRRVNIFFEDNNYSDKDYFKEYPTIHHLIYELMHNTNPHDVRLVYLACAYLLKHRGHFLHPVDIDNIDKITDISLLFDNFVSAIENICELVPFEWNKDDFSKVLKKKMSVTSKENALNKLFFNDMKPKKDKYDIRFDIVFKLLCGGKSKISDLFKNDDYKELDKNSISVASVDFSDTLELLYGQIREDEHYLLSCIKAIYDWSLLIDILHDKKCVSESKVCLYEQHKKDLKLLKEICAKYLTKDEYNEIFRNVSDKPNYVRYVNNASSDNIKNKYHKCYQEDFCKFINKYLEKISAAEDDKEKLDNLIEKCKKHELCPKQVTTDNRVIPYQLLYVELKKILENASGYLPFLKVYDKYGSVKDKILKIMEFRIPYYVGPLVSHEKNKNAWMVRKREGKIYPWNFDDMVDKDKSEDQFIHKMTSKCTYLAGEDVLPKWSLLYCKFNVLNEINNICVDGKPISESVKQKIFNELFQMRNVKVTKKRIKDFLIIINEAGKESEITGIDDNIKSSLKSYHDFKKYLDNGILTEKNVEEIIERITVTSDNQRLKKWLKYSFSHLCDDDIGYISKLKYNDYGRLSRRLLEDIIGVDENGEVSDDRNIITALWETNDNFMKLMSIKYHYKDSIDKLNKEYDNISENKSISKRINDMYISPAVRRSVHRTLDIVKDLRGILGKAPDKIFIEMARYKESNSKEKIKLSRRRQIEEVFKLAENTANDIDLKKLSKQLEHIDDGKLRSEKYFLYFMQLGKCMYTEKTISFEELEDNYKWNIDHIWPQSKVKDDSLDNKVLVDTNANGAKRDIYPISAEIRNKMCKFWKRLYTNKLITEKKFLRLTRNTAFTDDELSGFIARQIVETSQSTKAVITILNEVCPESEIVYVKAGLVSEFRHDMEMFKCREINDLHHAKDAYLNIVVGNIYNVKFTSNPLNFIKNRHTSNEKYSLKLFNKNQNGEAKGLLTYKISRNNEVAWDPETSFDIVRKMMSKNSIRYVRYTYKRKGGFFDQAPVRKKEGLVPRKKGLDTEKYGGYNKTSVSFYFLVKVKKDIVFVPIELLYADKSLTDDEYALNIVYKTLGDFYSKSKYKNIELSDISFPIGKRAIKINTTLEIDGFRVNIRGKNVGGTYVSVSSAVPLVVEYKYEQYIHNIESFYKKYKDNNNLKANSYTKINCDKNIELYDYLTEKCVAKPFSNWPKFAEAGEILKNGRYKFIAEDATTQALNIMKILMILKTGRVAHCDLKFVDGVSNYCTVRFNSTLSNKKNKSIYIIDQSPTGLYESKSEKNLLSL